MILAADGREAGRYRKCHIPKRAGWGLFRDRRPDLYAPLMTLDGG